MPTYAVFSLTAAFLFASSLLVNKYLVKHRISSSDSLMAYFLVTAFGFTLFLAPFVKKEWLSGLALRDLMGALIPFLVGYYLMYRAMKLIDISSLAPLFQIQSVMVVVLSFVFLGERFRSENYVIMALVVLGAILLSVDEKLNLKSFFTKGFLLGLLVQVLHAISNLYVGYTLRRIDFVQLLFWEYLIMGMVIIPFILWKKPRLSYPKKDIVGFTISNWINCIGALLLFRAYQENIGLSSVLAMASAPIVFIISVVLSRFKPELLEYHTRKVYVIRLIGLVLIISGAVYLVTG